MAWHISLCLSSIILIASLFGSSASYSKEEVTVDPETLVLVHVFFRDGDRTPSKSGLYKTNPYYDESFYAPYGYGQLTNDGKRKEYDLGVALRNRYDAFLGDTWDTKVYDAWSTDYNRTKMSLSLVLAGLFPPRGSLVWNGNLLWEPVPYNYLPFSEDRVLSSWGCPTVIPLIYGVDSNMERLSEYDDLIEALKNGTGEDVDYISALDLYLGMVMQTELEYPLENWTSAIFPEPFKTFYVDFYYIETSTRQLKTVLAGYLLKKVIADTRSKITGDLVPPERKIFLYSGHEVNAATVLTSLDAYNVVDAPPYGSYLLFEVHNIDGVYGIKIFYQTYKNEDPDVIVLPGCQAFCPLDDFIRLTANIIPVSDVECLGQ